MVQKNPMCTSPNDSRLKLYSLLLNLLKNGIYITTFVFSTLLQLSNSWEVTKILQVPLLEYLGKWLPVVHNFAAVWAEALSQQAENNWTEWCSQGKAEALKAPCIFRLMLQSNKTKYIAAAGWEWELTKQRIMAIFEIWLKRLLPPWRVQVGGAYGFSKA